MNNNVIMLVLINSGIFCANMVILSKCEEKLGESNLILKIKSAIPIINIVCLITLIVVYFKAIRNHVFTYMLDDKKYTCYVHSYNIGVINDLNTGEMVHILNFNKLLEYLVSDSFKEDEFITDLFDTMALVD